jgi:hypothetical protein
MFRSQKWSASKKIREPLFVCVVVSHNVVYAFDVLTVRYGLDGSGIESRWGEIFRTHSDRPWGPPSLMYSEYQLCFPGVKRPWRGLNHPPPLSPRLKKE